MTDESFLWAIFILLSVGLVVQIITARRGPWQTPPKESLPSRYLVGVDPACDDGEGVIALFRVDENGAAHLIHTGKP